MNNFSSQLKQLPLERGCSVRWTHASAQKEAAKYHTRKDFKAECAGGFNYAQRHKILNKICSHMPPPKPVIKWSSEMLIEYAKHYDNPYDFRRYEPTAYRASKRIGCYEKIIEQMKSKGSKPRKSLKKLALFKRIEIRSFNEARVFAGLKPLKIKIRKCITCGTDFESIEARTCGCLSEATPVTRFDPLLN